MYSDSSSKQHFFLGMKLALPFEDYFEEYIPDYYEFMQNSLYFLPYNLYLSMIIILKDKRLHFSKEITDKNLSVLEYAVFQKSTKLIEYFFDNIRTKPGVSKTKIEDLLYSVFGRYEQNVDILALKDDYSIFAGDLGLKVSIMFISADITNDYSSYLKHYEESDIPAISKELTFALFRFIDLIGDIEPYNFKLRETISDIFINNASYKYPIGGYSEITSERDEPERLLYSELIYMGEDIGKTDLFTIKYLENDLLYLKRDENSFYGSAISFIFDLSNVRLFIKDRKEFIPEYLLILIFIKSVIKVITTEISEMRTYFILKGVPANIQGVVRYFLPEGIDIENPDCPDDIKKGISIYTVFNGKIKSDIKYDIKKSISIDRDKFKVGKTKIRLFDKRKVVAKLKDDRDGLRNQIQDNYVNALKGYFKFLKL